MTEKIEHLKILFNTFQCAEKLKKKLDDGAYPLKNTRVRIEKVRLSSIIETY